MAALIFMPDTADEKPDLLVDSTGKVLSAKNIDEAVVVESNYVGYAVWDSERVSHRIDDYTCYHEAASETFAPSEACGEEASFEFDSLNPNFRRVEGGVSFPTTRAVSSAKTTEVVVGSKHMFPIEWNNYPAVDGGELTGYGKGVKELYDKAINDLIETMPDEGALTPPKKFCLTAEDTEDGKAIWFKMDGWSATGQVGLQPSSDAVLARTYAGLGAEIEKENYEYLEDLNTVRYEYGTLCYVYSILGGNGIDDDYLAAYNTVRWRLMSFPTVRAGVKVSFCVATELNVSNKSNTRTTETEGITVSTDTSGDSSVTTTETAKNTVVTQPLSALEGVPLMVYNLKEFKNEVETDKETVWEFESCGKPVDGYVVPKVEWCCSTSVWEYVQGGGESKITITVPESRTVMLGVESGGLWGQVTEFVKDAQASVYEEKYWWCKSGAFKEGHKKKEEHIAGGAYVWQKVTLVDNAEISFG